jgi:SDR family mycofactocin-dependent oxidoreductase
MSGRLAGKVALVTGAARGQGRAEAVMLASEGADVIAIDVCRDLPEVDYPLGTSDELAETRRLVEEHDRRIVTAEADVRDRDAMGTAIDGAVAELGRLDIVVANAGITMLASWDETTPELWDAHIGICLTGVWNTFQLTIPHIKAGGRGGSVIAISSASGHKGSPWLSAYVAAKHGVIGLTKSFALELAGDMIRVNAILPTGVETQIGGPGMREEFAARAERSPLVAALFINPMPVEILQPDDIARAVVFLASDDSTFITGVALPVDAGNALI